MTELKPSERVNEVLQTSQSSASQKLCGEIEAKGRVPQMSGKLCEHYNYSRRQQVKVQPGNVRGDSGQFGKYTFMVCSFG